jgi:integrase/recombinase XerC
MKGIRKDRRGFRAYVQVGTQQRQKRFPATASVKQMQAWRDEARVALRKTLPEQPASGTLLADIGRYLAQVKAMPTIAQRMDHLEKWAAALGGHTRRSSLTPEQLRTVMHQWRGMGLSPATCNKRRTALMHLFSILDGKDARNPVRAVPKFRVEDPLPRGRDYATLRQSLDAMQDSRTKARLLVMFWCGMRPVEVMRAQPDDIAWAERYIVVRTAKGGRTRNVPLTSEAVKAWRLFDRLEAWGDFTVAPMGRMLKKATGLDVKVYDLRHSYGTALARSGTRLDAIGALMGHSSLELTKRYTLAAVGPEALAATQRLGRSARRSA